MIWNNNVGISQQFVLDKNIPPVSLCVEIYKDDKKYCVKSHLVVGEKVICKDIIQKRFNYWGGTVKQEVEQKLRRLSKELLAQQTFLIKEIERNERTSVNYYKSW